MTQPTEAAQQDIPTESAATRRGPSKAWFLRTLDKPSDLFAHLTPNWFASIMGTGILANASALLPLQVPGLRVIATIVWATAALLLLMLSSATVVHWMRHRSTAESHHVHPVMAHFYGAPPMAFLTVAAGSILLGKDLIGESAAVLLGTVLWFAGTAMGLFSAVLVPYLTFTRHDVSDASACGGWLMPVVPPMVSAATGALLLPYTPAGELRLTLMLACYAMLGLSFFASLIVITLIWLRLARHKPGPVGMVPTLWIVLGPLGQSITAACLLGANAQLVVPAPWSTALEISALIFGIPVLGFALLWVGLAAAITLRTARDHLPFSLTWWSFTFSIGTCATGTSLLAVGTGALALHIMAVAFFVGLVLVWATVAWRTFHGSMLHGQLFLPPQQP